MSEDLYAAHIYVSGRVQGVGFRFYTIRVAKQFGLTGWVRNLYDGRVEIYAEGNKSSLSAFIEEIKVGPPSAHVSNLVQQWDKINARKYSDFSIVF